MLVQDALQVFHDKIRAYYEDHGREPNAGSNAAFEQASYQDAGLIVSAWSIATLLIEHIAEHVSVCLKVMSPPSEFSVYGTCVRSMLESSALASWLLDPSIDAHNRVSRVFSIRYEGLVNDLSLAAAAKLPQAERDKITMRIKEVEQEASGLGFPPVLTNKGKRSGIGQVFPTATEIIENVLGEKVYFKVLAGLAHGQTGAILRHSYNTAATVTVGDVLTQTAEKHAAIELVYGHTFRAMKALAMPMWNQCHYFGWDALRLEEIFEDFADSISLTVSPRFWRP